MSGKTGQKEFVREKIGMSRLRRRIVDRICGVTSRSRVVVDLDSWLAESWANEGRGIGDVAAHVSELEGWEGERGGVTAGQSSEGWMGMQ